MVDATVVFGSDVHWHPESNERRKVVRAAPYFEGEWTAVDKRLAEYDAPCRRGKLAPRCGRSRRRHET